jgi:hypothetical protein
MYADFMIWPWLERLKFIEIYRGFIFDKNRLANFISYIERMNNVSACQKLLTAAEKYEKFFEAKINKEQRTTRL